MNLRHFHVKALYRAANGAVLACIGLFMPFLGISEVTWRNIFVLAVTLSLLVGISLLPARGRGLSLLLTVLCLGLWAAFAGLRTSYQFLQAYFQWCGGYAGGQEQWLRGFQLMHTMVITAAAFLVQIFLEKVKGIKYVLAFVLADGMLFSLFAKITLTHMGVVFVLLFIVTVYVEWLQEHWEKRRMGSLKAQMLWLTPFLCVYLLLMAIMPAPRAPYDWRWAINIYNHVMDSLQVVTQSLFHGGNEDFSIALSGFTDDGKLGKGVGEDPREVMRIQSQSSLATNLYLIGKVYDTFDGRQWLQEYGDGEKERFLDTMETLYAVRRFDNQYFTDYLKVTNIRIQYGLFQTKYVFAPLKAKSIQGNGKNLNYSFEGADLVLEKRKGYGTEYDVVYYQINVGGELFEQLLETPQEPDEEIWNIIAGENEKQIGQRITLEQMEVHRQAIQEYYLEEVALSEEAENYLQEITRDAGTDLEKLQAIERELNSFTYTNQPGSLPEKVTNTGEFLDYFLLESRQGYCTYFATAFVLLARAEGIPARYVQGFCVPMKGSREAAVLSNMAHAWPEVYLEGVGWIPFEPTPGYVGLRYTPWEVSARRSLSAYEAEEEVDDGESESVPTDSAGVLEEEEESETEESEFAAGFRRLWRVLIVGVPALLAVFVLVLLLDNLLFRYRYRRMNPAEKLKVEVHKNLRILSWSGLQRREQETLQELRERGMLVLGLAPMRFIEDYEDMVYGGKKVGQETLERVKRERKQLWELLRKEKKWAYVIYRIRMLI